MPSRQPAFGPVPAAVALNSDASARNGAVTILVRMLPMAFQMMRLIGADGYMLDGVDNNETWLQTVVIFPSPDALDEFKNRWEEGVNNLCQDVEEMAGRLGKIAMNYFETDKAGYDALSGLKGTIAAIKVM